ncbi:hypothetical protein NW767_007116 [Fusarium falciforme]|nr:hypothetical protein NW767_007116 [Fusarium falciforme]
MSALVRLREDQPLNQLGFGLYLLFILSTSLYILMFMPDLAVSHYVGGIKPTDVPQESGYTVVFDPLLKLGRHSTMIGKNTEDFEGDL